MTPAASQSEYTKRTIDTHHHFFTKDSVKAFNQMIPPETYKDNSEFQQFLKELPTTDERIKLTVTEMEKSNVDQILLMSFSGDFDTIYQAHLRFPEKFPALIPFVDPRYDTPEIMEDYKKKGAVSIKFYPGSWGNDFNFNDPRMFPYLTKCLELDLIPMVHFGVMKGGPVNLNAWPANPLELRPWLQNPKLIDQKYIIAHFGAGYLREVFLMAYSHQKRLYVDTSGSNDWIIWSPFPNLSQVFEKSIHALTPQHILFGTDSGRLTMRHDVALRQKGILEDLVTRRIITDEDRWDILGNNVRRLLLSREN
ncbi:MAG: amidohydrolase family protein [Candidatus Hodarchaeales archaeon]|jgi:predicted TIM-barrel fold metal-dependent hydrolase